MFQPSYLPEIQIWLVSEYSRLIESRKRNESLQHKSTRRRCEILGEWTTIASSKNTSRFCYNMWTCCPRQTWPQSSLIIKHYRVQEGEPSLMTSKSPRVEVQRVHLGQTPLSLNNSISGLVCSEHIWNEGCKSPDHRILRTYAWLTWDDSRGSKTNFLKFTAATFTKCTCIRGSHSFHQTNTSWASMKKMLSKVSNTSLMLSKIM